MSHRGKFLQIYVTPLETEEDEYIQSMYQDAFRRKYLEKSKKQLARVERFKKKMMKKGYFKEEQMAEIDLEPDEDDNLIIHRAKIYIKELQKLVKIARERKAKNYQDNQKLKRNSHANLISKAPQSMKVEGSAISMPPVNSNQSGSIALTFSANDSNPILKSEVLGVESYSLSNTTQNNAVQNQSPISPPAGSGAEDYPPGFKVAGGFAYSQTQVEREGTCASPPVSSRTWSPLAIVKPAPLKGLQASPKQHHEQVINLAKQKYMPQANLLQATGEMLHHQPSHLSPDGCALNQASIIHATILDGNTSVSHDNLTFKKNHSGFSKSGLKGSTEAPHTESTSCNRAQSLHLSPHHKFSLATCKSTPENMSMAEPHRQQSADDVQRVQPMVSGKKPVSSVWKHLLSSKRNHQTSDKQQSTPLMKKAKLAASAATNHNNQKPRRSLDDDNM